MSQKQRKRQSSTRKSESEGAGGGDLASSYRIPESVWNVPVQNEAALATPPGFVELSDKGRKSKTPNGNGGGGGSSSSLKKKPHEARMINFDAILLEDKREKEYFEKLKSKPLTLTQMEEAAIGELFNFYNVDQVFDETIEICRKVRQQVSHNFSQWGRSGGAVDNPTGASGGELLT